MRPVIDTFAKLIITVATLFFLAPSVQADTFTVNSPADEVDANPGDGVCATASGGCTLRAAIMEANALPGPHTINLPAGTYLLAIDGTEEDFATSGDLDIIQNITINGAGANTTIIDGNGIDRIFDIQPGAVVTINGVTIQNGNVAGYWNGGGIQNLGTLTLNDSAVSLNNGGDGGGIMNQGSLQVNKSTIGDNYALNGSGGGINNNGGNLTLNNSTISNNTAECTGGGIFNTVSGYVKLSNSTTSANTAADGGGLGNFGALQARNSTISGNTATGLQTICGTLLGQGLGQGGGVFNDSSAVADFYNVTITNNQAADLGGGIFFNFGEVSVKNTIVANSISGGNCDSPPIPFGHNLSSDGTCYFTGSGGLDNTGPLLGPLANNGGPTLTHALLEGSPAIDAGDPGIPGTGGNTCEATDQRGVARPVDGNVDGIAICDIGAFELAAVADTTPPSAPTGLTASPGADGATQINLSWTASTDDVTAQANLIYRIWQSTTTPVNTVGAPSYTTPAGATSFTVTGLSPGTTYYFRIQAVDEAGNASADSNEASATTALSPVVILVNESITVSDVPTVTPPAMITVNESILVSDAVTVSPPAIITVAEAIIVSDAPSVTVPQLPVIAGFMPTSGPVGASVAITGTNFTGAMAVMFNGTNAIFIVDSSTQITAAVPAGATTGPISVTTPNGTATSAAFFTVKNTIVGKNSVVAPADTSTGNTPATLTFSNVTADGFTSLTSSGSGPPPPKGFKLGDLPVYFNLTTTALFTGPVEVCIDYTGITFTNESQLRLFHFEDTNGDTIADAWVNHTVSLNTVKNIICASVTSLSPFAIFERESLPVITVTNQEDNTVSFINPETNQVVDTVQVGHKPTADTFFDLIFDSFAPPAKLYVVERGNGKEKKGKEKDKDDGDDEEDDGPGVVRVLVGPSAPTDSNAFDFDPGNAINVGKRPEGLALTPDGAQLWVANRNSDSISIIDRATEAVIATVPLKKKIASKGKSKGEVESTIGRQPAAVGFSPDGQFAYVAGRDSNNLIVLDAANAVANPANAILGYVDVGNKPAALAVDAGRGLVYVVNRGSNRVAVVDVTLPVTPKLLAKIAVGEEPEAVALLSDGSKLYVANSESNTVSVLQVQSGSPFLTLVATIPVGQKPSAIAVTRPDSFVGGDFIYVADREDNTVSVIDTTIDQVIAVIPVGKGPRGVAAGLLPTAP